jgi:erythromycin esterase
MVTALQQDTELISVVRQIAHPLHTDRDLDPLVDRIGDAQFVLLGEASHGTSEYYTWRTRISKRLIQEKGFSFIAVEGDWPDCYRINRYVRGYADSGNDARTVLHAFARWPTWMWANWEIVALAEWLREYNNAQPAEKRIGFYGLDVYSLWESLEEITNYLEKLDPEALEAARRAMVCFQPYDRDVQAYAWTTRVVPVSCERDVLQLLAEMRRKAGQYKGHPGDGEAAFNAEQNALVAVGAEQYYRTMIEGGPASWNIRDYHMADTLDRLIQHYGTGTKAIVWEHNTHIGDARATDMASAGMINVGQLVRDRHTEDGVVLVGFGSYEGSVIAGTQWGAPIQRMQVPAAREGSWESVLHEALEDDGLMIFAETERVDNLLRRTRAHRAIGVVYNPDYERMGNYVPSSLPRRYDAFVYLDTTEALHPLHIEPEASAEPPETYPWAV